MENKQLAQGHASNQAHKLSYRRAGVFTHSSLSHRTSACSLGMLYAQRKQPKPSSVLQPI